MPDNQTQSTEELHITILNAISDAVYLTDENGDFTFVCQNVDVIFGYSQIEIEAFGNIFTLIPALERSVFDASEELQNIEMEITTKDGSRKMVLINIKPVVIRLGRFLFTLRDITDRFEMEVVLRENQALSQAVIQNSPIGISIRSRTGQLLQANDAWRKIWAIPEPAVIEDLSRERQSLVFNNRDHYLEPYQEEVRRVYEEGGSVILPELETSSSRPGAAEWVSQHFYALYDDQGKVDRVVILTEDITTRKRAEEERRRLHEQVIKDANELEKRVQERTRQYQSIIELTADREIRMAELKKVIKQLRAQLIRAGLEPVADDSLNIER